MKRRTRARKAGLPPGSLVHIGERQVDGARLSSIDYSPDRFVTRTIADLGELDACLGTDTVSWIDLVGLHDIPLIEGIGKTFGIHALVLEDILNTDQRPKVEVFDEYVFLVAKMIRPGEGDRAGSIEIEQVSFILGKSFLITFQERPGDVFGSVRERLKAGKGRLRRSGPDYLGYALLDGIVDNYFVVLDHLSTKMDSIESAVLDQSDSLVNHRIHRLKHDLLMLRKATWPLREIVSALIRDEPPQVAAESRPYLHDLYDHTAHVADTLDTYREMLSGLLEVHFSLVNTRMGEVMKVLTIIATIFIPLTFVAGVYGMNFEHMPELAWKWAYPAILAIMFSIAASLLVFFRLKHWI